jgi:hypothetical protein
MSEADLIDRLAAAVASRVSRQIPLDVDLWDMETIGAYMKRDVSHIQQRVVNRPDFPHAIRLPSAGKRGGQPLYKAIDVIRWTESYMEKN